MMENLLTRADALAHAEQQRKLVQVAGELKELLRGVTIEVEETRILMSGRGILKRWLLDPSLRFLSGGLR
jgi:hypothetical protein